LASWIEWGLDVVYDIEAVYFNESKDPKDRPPDALKVKIEQKELASRPAKILHLPESRIWRVRISKGLGRYMRAPYCETGWSMKRR